MSESQHTAAPRGQGLREPRACALSDSDADVSPQATQADTVDTLFYDGQCPLCASEIAQLRKVRGGSLKLVDIHDIDEARIDSRENDSSDDALAEAQRDDPGARAPGQQPSKDQLLRVLHLRRADGSWLTSADANVAAWEGTSHGKLLAVLRWPVIRHGADWVYALWARWRYRRLYGRQFKDPSDQGPLT